MTQNNSKKIVTRIAPSPTGFLHFGTARTALFNYLFTKKYNGKFIVRIEDTDRERSTIEYEKNILENLSWLGLQHDEFYRQSERTDIYRKYLENLIKSEKAYVSQESSGERSSVIRFKNPNKKITFNDLIRGEISFDTTELGDFVIAKSLIEPLYHLAVVIDDHEMGITHIIRGEDGISNTPRQILIQEAIGANLPEYAHLPLILGKDRSKMSKRHGPTALSEYCQRGYLKQALINYLAMLGWNPGDDRELFTLDDLINEFSIEKVSKSGAIFDENRLNWYNREYLKKIDDSFFLENTRKYFDKFKTGDDEILKLKNIIIERINVFADLKSLIEAGDFDCFFNEPDIVDINKINWKNISVLETKKHLESILILIKDSDSQIFQDIDKIKKIIWDYAEKNGKGNVLWPIRYILSGKEKSPDPFTLIKFLGKEKTIERIEKILLKLK
jgi:nondiscriminating glutamyl-tRNA synthetase